MESVTRAVILGIGETRVPTAATPTVVAERKPVIVALEPVRAVTLDITERTSKLCSRSCGGSDHACDPSTGDCNTCDPGYTGTACEVSKCLSRLGK